MSVVLGETPDQSTRDSALKADHTTELASSFPFCVTLWLYLDALPTQSDTYTIFWYGEQGETDNLLRCSATLSATSGFDITATLTGSSSSVTASEVQLSTETWYMITVVLEQTAGATWKITLYVDDNEADSASGDIGATAPGDYDRFLLGATDGGSDYGRFRAEHVAIWDAELSASNIETLADGPWTPLDGEELIDQEPGTAYWMLVGHWSAGIDAANGQGIGTRDQGLLFNQANASGSTSKPPLQMLDSDDPVVWSAATPVMRYLASQDLAPGPYIHPLVPPVSRLQPHFYIFNPVEQTFKYGAGEIPPYTMGNFTRPLQSDGQGANNLAPPVSSLTTYIPATDIALIAKRIADWFEFSGWGAGRGSVGDGQYEGYAFLRAVGLGDLAGPNELLRGFRGTLTTPDEKSPFTGMGSAVPLEMHPLDRVTSVTPNNSARPWHTWFRAHGSRLVKEYMDGFWTALKRELDERDLCYPRVLWWDQEDWARPNYAIRPDPDDPTEEPPQGTFTNQLADDRADEEEILPSKTLDDIYSGTPSYDDEQDIGSNYNSAFYQWYLGYSVPIRQQAVWEAMLQTAKGAGFFPLTTWSNYDGFTANNPDFLFPGNTWREAYNTAAETIQGDVSSPKLYTPGSLRKNVSADDTLQDLGSTFSQVLRNHAKGKIDACINSRAGPPVAPWFQTGLRRFETTATPGPDDYYWFTPEDAFDILAYAWMRGVDDFLIFIWDNPLDLTPPDPDTQKEANDLAYEVSRKLLNWVHFMPQAHGAARTARVSRLGRR
ncbi:MAG: LamG-like jellyroll fold domain-containing protein [Phycisphaerales bacterium JB039]